MAEDLDQLAQDLSRAVSIAIPLVTLAIKDTLGDIERTAQEIAPVRTGDYRASISHEMRGPLVGEVGPTDWKGHLVEGGGARSAPQRVMARATEKHWDDFGQRVQDAIATALW